MTRVESEEPQGHVCEMMTSQEEAEEFAFVPSALSEPRGSICFCDNRCSEKAVRYWQFASVVIEDGGKAPLSQFVSAVLQRADGAARQAEVEFLAMESSLGKESTSWEGVENYGECTFYKWIVRFLLSKGQRQRRFWKMRRGKARPVATGITSRQVLDQVRKCGYVM